MEMSTMHVPRLLFCQEEMFVTTWINNFVPVGLLPPTSCLQMQPLQIYAASRGTWSQIPAKIFNVLAGTTSLS